MTISVIITTAGLSQDLDACLAALRDQTMPPDEVIVAGRLDAKELNDYLSTWRESNKPEFRTTRVATGEVGWASVLNAAREGACSSIVCFTSDRCVPDKDWLFKIVGNFDCPLTGAVGGPVVDSGRKPTPVKDAARWGDIRWWGGRTDNTDQVPGRKLLVRALSRVNMSFRRHLMRDFDRNQRSENGLEEDMCLRLIAMGFKIVCDPETLVRQIRPAWQDTEPGAAAPRIVNAQHDNTYVFLKHAPLPQKLVFLFYTFLVGDDGFPGLLRRPDRISPGISRLRQIMLGLKGKLLGLGTYLSHLRQRPNPDCH